jgi:riboflavin kinase/FMN adenylyltransferase
MNLDWVPDLRPAFGVYAVRARAASGGPFINGVANYGVRPTVDGSGQPVLEIHLLDECPFSTGDGLHVQWLRHVRAEMRFNSVDELKAQIGRDRNWALEFFQASSQPSDA